MKRGTKNAYKASKPQGMTFYGKQVLNKVGIKVCVKGLREGPVIKGYSHN